MIIFNKDTERNNKKDRAQDVRIDSLQAAVDELNADIAEIEITVENLSQSIDDKYAAQTQTLMSELNSRIQSLISNLEDFVNTAQVNADVGNFKNLYATVLSNLKTLTVDYATVTQRATIAGATITNETVTSSQIQSLAAATAVISELTATLLHITNLAVTEFSAETVSSDGVFSRLGQFSDITVQEIADINLITGSTLHSPIGAPDNTELLKITVPHYKGTVHIIDYDNSFNVTIYDGAFISWSQQTMNLYRVQKGFNTTDLYFKDTDLNMSYKVLLVGSHYPVTVTSEIVDRTGIRQNVLTRNGVHGVAEGGSGGGASIVFVDNFPAEGEAGIIYISMTEGAKAWDDERNAFVSFVGSNLSLAVLDNTEHIGTLSNLTTTEKTNLVGAVNEIDSDVGNLTNLTTTAKVNLVGAVNEVDSHADTNAGAIATINGNDTGLSMREVAQDVTSNLYIPCGSVAFADLPALSGLRVGSVYDVTDSFTTTSDFIEGAGHVIPAGSNVAVVDYNGVKKWDVLGSMIDLSTYYTKAQTDNLLAEKTDLSVIAPEFSVSTSYAVGDYVTYDGKLYECTTAHPAGAWVSSDFTEKTVSGITSSSSEYMAKVNPTGTGSFSLNRKANTTIGDYSHAEGYETTASRICAHAEGANTTASGIYSHAEGIGTMAEAQVQHVQGKFNVRDTNGIYIDIIGNGTTDNDRKNIEATTRTGDKRLKGTVYINCNDDSTGGTDIVLAAYPVGSLYWTSNADFNPNVSFGGTWTRIKDKFVYAMGDNDTLNATGGAKTVTLTSANLPTHTHSFTPSGTIGSSSGATDNKTADAGKHSHTRGTMEITGSWSRQSDRNILATNDSVTGAFYRSNKGSYKTFGDSSGSFNGSDLYFKASKSWTGSTSEADSHSHTAYFKGTAGTTGDGGFANTAVDKMPPYICKYCWERTA